jgi:hypothetical protein
MHTVELSDPDGRYLPTSKSIVVDSANRAEVAFALRAGPSSFRAVTLWSGVGACGLGAAALAYAIAAPQHILQIESCTNGHCSSTGGFAGTNNYANPSMLFPSNHARGVLIAPLGYSAIALGATWILGSLFLGDDSDPPWLGLLLGVGVGLTSYGVSALVH